MKNIKSEYVITTFLVLLGIGWYYYSTIDRSVYTIEREFYRGEGVRKNTSSVEPYNNPFNSLESCLNEADRLNKNALNEYKIKMIGYQTESQEYTKRTIKISIVGPVAPKPPHQYGCIMYHESDLNSWAEKYNKLFPN